MAGLPFAAIGISLCVTVIGIPPGLFFLALSGLPLALVMRKHKRQQLPREEIPPWLGEIDWNNM